MARVQGRVAGRDRGRGGSVVIVLALAVLHVTGQVPNYCASARRSFLFLYGRVTTGNISYSKKGQDLSTTVDST